MITPATTTLTVTAPSAPSAYTTGVTGNGTEVGTLTFVVPTNAPATLYYDCSIHSGMAGVINL